MIAAMSQPPPPQGSQPPPYPPPIPVVLDNETRDTLKLARLTMKAIWVFAVLSFVAWLWLAAYLNSHRFG